MLSKCLYVWQYQVSELIFILSRWQGFGDIASLHPPVTMTDYHIHQKEPNSCV